LVLSPFSDLSGSKIRPAVVVNAEHISKDLIVVPLTSKTSSLLKGEFILFEWAEPNHQLFLAVSEAIYLKHFQKPIFQLAIKRNKINLLVYAPEQEVIIQWITH
jgi:XisH protein